MAINDATTRPLPPLHRSVGSTFSHLSCAPQFFPAGLGGNGVGYMQENMLNLICSVFKLTRLPWSTGPHSSSLMAHCMILSKSLVPLCLGLMVIMKFCKVLWSPHRKISVYPVFLLASMNFSSGSKYRSLLLLLLCAYCSISCGCTRFMLNLYEIKTSTV